VERLTRELIVTDGARPVVGTVPESADRRVSISRRSVRGVSDTTIGPFDTAIGRNILVLVTEERAGATALKAAVALAESVGGWLTVAVPIEPATWQTAWAALGGHAVHPAVRERMAHTELQRQLGAIPQHVKTHGVLLRGPLGAALLARAHSAGHDVIVVPGCPRLLALRGWLQLRSSVPICVSNDAAELRWQRERRKRCRGDRQLRSSPS
jgi:universal stress protein family protein